VKVAALVGFGLNFLVWFAFFENRYFYDNDKKTLENSKIKILRDPDFTLKSKYQHLKLWCKANKIDKNKKFCMFVLR